MKEKASYFMAIHYKFFDKKSRCAELAAMLLLLGTSLDARADSLIQVVQPAKKYQSIQPSDAIIFDIKPSIIDERIQSLYMEVDGVDVTPSVSLNGRRASYQPSERLPIGDHQVRILEHLGNEKYSEVTRFIVRIGGTGSEDLKIWGNVEGQASKLIVAQRSNTYKNLDKNSGSGFNETHATTGGKNWDINAVVNSNFDTNTENNSDNQTAQLGSYLLTARAFNDIGSAKLRFGNHDIDVSNVLMEKFYRRGASIEAEGFNHLRMIAFAQNPSRAIGDSDVTGFGNSDEVVNGGYMQYFPLGNDHHFFVESTYIDGSGREKGRAEALVDNVLTKGSGYQFGSEWTGFSDKAKLRGEFAETSFDYDGNDSLISSLNDKAWSGQGSVAVIGDLNSRTYDETGWSWTFVKNHIGTFFHSLTNGSLPSDQNRLGVTSDFHDQSLSIVLDGYTSKNNVNQLDLPTDETRGVSLQTSVSPLYFMAPTDDGTGWFENSLLSAGFYKNKTQRSQTPSGFLGDDLNYGNMGLNFGWNASFDDTLTLSLSHTYTEYRDDVFSVDNQDSHLSEVALSYAPSETLDMTLSIQKEKQSFNSFADRSNYLLGFDINTIIISDKLSNHTYTSMQLNDSGSDDRQYNASSDFLWTIKTAEKNSFGYGIAVNANYQSVYAKGITQRNDAGSDFRLYTSFKINTPFGW